MSFCREKGASLISDRYASVKQSAPCDLVAMLVLFESADGYGLFKVLDSKRVSSVQNVQTAFSSIKSARETVQLISWEQFHSTADATEAAVSLNEHKIPAGILKSIQEHMGDNKHLAVAEQMLASTLQVYGIIYLYFVRITFASVT
ncbi:hypothetical protein KIPB_002861 [Kipferlia bialata]|uniref:Nucleolar protein 58/56 N-terminal domain-containing protein n=1 Tax=Kipferlia bialata TaxID=797122 RepID=A0A9K3CTI3_9EUKA|nr:hypothetical protein KIPB_002861 [Kipferlia bialata]|eukprot:g2861.t1